MLRCVGISGSAIELGTVSAERDFKRAAAAYRKAKEGYELASSELHEAMRRARAEGMTYDAMARAVGVSRQRVMDILKS